MLANAIVSPYMFTKGNIAVKLTFHYGTKLECLDHLNSLHSAASLPTREQQEMIEAIVYSRHSRVVFDPCWLEDFHENVLFEARVIQVITDSITFS